MHTRFTVGEVAKLSGLSKQALIYYDREGVFSPRFVDPGNGYRYYTAEQLEVLDSILMLKEMGLSLGEIRDFMKSRNDSRAIELMSAQRRRIHEKMRRLERTARKLERKIGTLKAFYDDPQDGVLVQEVPGDILAAESVEAPGHLEEQDVALKRLLRRAKEENYPHYYQLGTMVAAEDIRSGDPLRARYAFLPLEEEIAGCMRRPAGKAAFAYHVGTYEQTGVTYQRLLRTIEDRGLEPYGYAYEYCVLDSLTSERSDDYVTKILLPVR